MLNGKFIGVREEANVFVVERKFAVRFAKQLILRATALGVYFAEVNGVRVGDGYLAPGWTTYNKTLQVQEYATLRRSSKRAIPTLSLMVGEGWYRPSVVEGKTRCLRRPHCGRERDFFYR